MHILIATPYLPWPLIEGGRVAQYRTFEAMREACSFTLVAPVYSPEEVADAQKFADLFPNVTVRPVRCFQAAAPVAMRSRVRGSAGKFLRKFLPPANPSTTISSKMPDEVLPYYPFSRLNPDFVAGVEEELAKGCDIFQAEFSDMLTLGPLMAGRVASVFVHHQLHFVYARRFLEADERNSVNARYLTERMIREEFAYLNTFDSAIVFSEVDKKSLEKFCPALETNVSPFPSPENPILNAPTFDAPAGRFVFVASESHQPNVDGFRWFMQEVWPEIRGRLPGAGIEVIGRWSQPAQTSLPHHEEIKFSGFAPDLAKALQSKIMVVPVWVGSGIRTKILAAWSAACPVVTTTVGVEGLPGQTDEHFIVADAAPAFAAACIALSQDAGKLRRIANNALQLVQRHYSLEAVRNTRLDVYRRILAKGR